MTDVSLLATIGAVGRHRLPALRLWTGRIGLTIVMLIVLVAIAGPALAPYPIDQPVGVPGQAPDAAFPLGTDYLGRDVLSRALSGGRSILLLALAATTVTYALALTVGLLAGHRRWAGDSILMRLVDLMLSIPPMLLLLVLVAGAGNSIAVIVVGVGLVLFPGAARIIRTAAVEVSVQGFVEAANARGEGTFSVIRREIMPNITPVFLADLGIRFSAGIVLIASLNFLGLGLQPPVADWGLMVTENRSILALNPIAVAAPVVLLSLLTIGVNLVADAYVRGRASRGRS